MFKDRVWKEWTVCEAKEGGEEMEVATPTTALGSMVNSTCSWLL